MFAAWDAFFSVPQFCSANIQIFLQTQNVRLRAARNYHVDKLQMDHPKKKNNYLINEFVLTLYGLVGHFFENGRASVYKIP